MLAPGHAYHLDLAAIATARLSAPGETQDGGISPMWAGRWWKLELQAHEVARVSWSCSDPSSGFCQFLVFSPSTTDANVTSRANNNQQLQLVNAAASRASGTFRARTKGAYPFIIGNGCPSTSGPLDFTVTVSIQP